MLRKYLSEMLSLSMLIKIVAEIFFIYNDVPGIGSEKWLKQVAA